MSESKQSEIGLIYLDWQNALLIALLDEIDRVYWNRHQQEWNRYEALQIQALEYRPYYWGEDEEEAAKPNFKFEDVEIGWYKHPGRGSFVNKHLSAQEWADWYLRASLEINSLDRPQTELT